MAFKRIVLVAAMAVSGPASADSNWEYTGTLYGWFPGATTTVETDFGEFEAEADFDDILENLDLALFGALEARNGRWSFVADTLYADLGVETGTPFATVFDGGEIDTKLGLISAYAAYAVVDQSDLRVDLGIGLRYNDLSVETLLIGADPNPNVTVERDGSWTDLLVSGRVRQGFNEKWHGVAYADVGGFGIEDSANLTWQVFAGAGYRLNETWSLLGGYRYLSIDRDFRGAEITADTYGPQFGVQVAF